MQEHGGVFELDLIVLRWEKMGELDSGFGCFVLRNHAGVLEVDLTVWWCENLGGD